MSMLLSKPGPFAPYEAMRAWLDQGLNDPGDPYGLADTPQRVVDYMAPMFDDYRAEYVRRVRMARASQEAARA